MQIIGQIYLTLAFIADIKQQNNDVHLLIKPDLLPNICEDLFPKRVCEKWEAFGTHFGVADERLSEIKRQKEKDYPHGNADEKNFFEVVKILRIGADGLLTFSKRNIYEALKKCHPEHAEKFKAKYYKKGPL